MSSKLQHLRLVSFLLSTVTLSGYLWVCGYSRKLKMPGICLLGTLLEQASRRYQQAELQS